MCVCVGMRVCVCVCMCTGLGHFSSRALATVFYDPFQSTSQSTVCNGASVVHRILSLNSCTYLQKNMSPLVAFNPAVGSLW